MPPSHGEGVEVVEMAGGPWLALPLPSNCQLGLTDILGVPVGPQSSLSFYQFHTGRV